MKSESVVVCGSGIVGLATVLGLTRAGIKAVLLGPRHGPAPMNVDEYCPRVYAISLASQQFLAQLGVWNMLDADRIAAVEAMEVHGDANGQVTLRAWQATQPTLAWIVESSEIERVLQHAVHVFGIAWRDERFQQLEPGAIVTESGQRLEADLVVGADGANSPVRTAAGINHRSSPYGDVGLVAHLNSEYFHQQTAVQWFTGDSVLALLPLPDTSDGHQVSMVWSAPQAMASQVLALPEPQRNELLQTHLQQISGGRLGRLQVRSPVFGFPLYLESSAMVAPGVALVGDAAHRVHPLAGQGLNLGLADAAALLHVLGHRESYRGVGERRVLERYRRQRAEAILAMRLATDGLYRLFAARATPVAWARNLGMRGLERVPFLKQRLIAAASGTMINDVHGNRELL